MHLCILKAYFREKYEYFSISIYRSVVFVCIFEYFLILQFSE